MSALTTLGSSLTLISTATFLIGCISLNPSLIIASLVVGAIGGVMAVMAKRQRDSLDAEAVQS
jgi:hypothetical protein